MRARRSQACSFWAGSGRSRHWLKIWVCSGVPATGSALASVAAVLVLCVGMGLGVWGIVRLAVGQAGGLWSIRRVRVWLPFGFCLVVSGGSVLLVFAPLGGAAAWGLLGGTAGVGVGVGALSCAWKVRSVRRGMSPELAAAVEPEVAKASLERFVHEVMFR